MYQKGLLRDGDIYADLDQIITSAKPGRESDDEIIYFNSVGLSYLDTALSYWMYQRALMNGKGTPIVMTQKSMFEK